MRPCCFVYARPAAVVVGASVFRKCLPQRARHNLNNLNNLIQILNLALSRSALQVLRTKTGMGYGGRLGLHSLPGPESFVELHHRLRLGYRTLTKKWFTLSRVS
jgi:hypothetical protein